MISSYRDLVVWQKSLELTALIYQITRELPQHEIYGLVSQMRRAAVSVASNIAEGHQRRNRKEFLQFLGIALGSIAELDTQMIVAQREYNALSFDVANGILIEVLKMIRSMERKLSLQPLNAVR